MSKIHPRPGRVGAVTAVAALLAAAGAGALDAAGTGAAVPLPRAAPVAATCTSGLIGDVTGDDAVNIIDAQQIARAAAGLTVSTTVQDRLLSHGDVTDDGNTNIIDAQQIARWAAGLSTSFPIGESCSSGTTGDLQASNTTSGTDPSQPYTVSLDGGSPQNMPVDGSYTFENITAGTHSVTIGNLQGCSLGTTSATQEVEVPAGGLGQVSWSVAC